MTTASATDSHRRSAVSCFSRHIRCALHRSWWLRISRRKFELPSTKDVRMSGISLHHFRQYVQYMTPDSASNCSQSNISNQFGRKRPPLRGVVVAWANVVVVVVAIIGGGGAMIPPLFAFPWVVAYWCCWCWWLCIITGGASDLPCK